jgi:exonuclease III
MIALSWNCRGLGNPQTVHELRRMVNEKKPNLVFLMETKLRQKKMEIVRIKLGFHNMFVVDCVGKSGGLALLWESDFDIEIQNFTRRHINAVIRSPMNAEQWKFSCIYGHPETAKRHESWTLMKHLAELAPEPWVCLGDFNEVVSMEEKRGGSERHRTQMRAFQQALEECSLSDLGYSGPKYTWQNYQEGDCLVKERLDRGVANNAWRRLFPDAEIVVTSAIFSDHAPIFLTLTRGRGVRRRSTGFRFESSWAMEKNYQDLVVGVWNKVKAHGNKWDTLHSKLLACVQGIITWRRETKEDLQLRLIEKKNQLLAI